MSIPVVILSGGLATRLQPHTEKIPKGLLEVAGKPFAVHQIELLRRNGLRDVVFCVGHLGEQIEAALQEGRRWDVRLRYVYDGPVLLGTGGAIRKALPLLGTEFLVMYGDSYLECDYGAVIRAFHASGRQALMTVFRNRNQWDRSNVAFDQGIIRRYDKTSRTPDMQYIDYGLGAFQAQVFAGYAEDQPLDLARVYQDVLAAGQLAGCEIAERFYEIGSPEGLAETSKYLTHKEEDL